MRTKRLALFAAVFLTASAASAARVFVASTGTDGGTCARTAPCRTFAYAITQVTAGGEVVALDTAGYGPVTIPFAVSIYAAPGQVASITATTVPAIQISAAPGDAISVRNLFIDSDGTQHGIRFDSGTNLTVENTTFSNVNAGLFMLRTLDAADTEQIAILNCRFVNSTDGVNLDPNTGSAYVTVRSSEFTNLFSSAVKLYDPIVATVSDSTFAGKGFAIAAIMYGTSNGLPTVDVERSTFFNNSTVFYADNGAVIRVVHSIITRNTTPVWIGAAGGQVLSGLEGTTKTNTLESNGGPSTFSGTFTAN